MHSGADISLAQKLIGYSPAISLENGFQLTLQV